MTRKNEIQQQVYIIDDDDAVRDAMGMLMESSGLVSKGFTEAQEFLDYYDGSQRGCLVLDIRMPGMTGLELQEKLKSQNSMLPIIFITGHGDIPMAVEAMRNGAIDFMRKPISESELLERIRYGFEHEVGMRSKAESGLSSLKLLQSLTKREQQVFHCVTDGQANKVIASNLDISERTVEVHRSQVMKKLGAGTLAQLVRIRINCE
jgi:two-component system response regulator FixJ